MRILYLSADPGVPILGHKGASVHVRALARALADLGCEVTVASPRVEPAENELPGVNLVEIPAVRPRDHADAGEVRSRAEQQAVHVIELARELRAEAIYERLSLSSLAGARAARALSLPLILEVNAPLRAEELRFRDLRHPELALAAEREELAAAHRVLAVSEPLADWLRGEGVEAERIEVVPNAFPVSSISRAHTVGERDDLVVGFAGGLKLWHGIDVLLDAFGRALAAGGRLRLEIAGQGPAEHHVASADLPAERFQFLGHLPHDAALERLGAWDVGLAPFTAVDGFWFSPLKILEYMAAGLAVVASSLGDIPRLLGGGDAGLLVAADDAEALSDALLRLDRDRELARALGSRAAARASEGPTWVDNARHALELFESSRVTA